MNQRLITAVAAVALLLGMSAPQATARAAGTGQTQSKFGQMQKFKSALEKLDLSDGQKKQIKQILADAKGKMQASQAADKTQKKQVMKDAGEKIIAILTPAQKKQLRQLMSSAKTSR